MIAPGTRVRVRDDWPETRGPCHIRTPHYLRGETGIGARAISAISRTPKTSPSPARPPSCRSIMSASRFPRCGGTGRPGEEILVELFEHWLEPVP